MANIEFKHQINLMKKNIDTSEKQAKLTCFTEKFTHEENIKVYKEIIKNLKALEDYGGAQNLIRHATGQVKQEVLFATEPPQARKITSQKQY